MIADQQLEKLNALLTLEDIANTISHLNNNKAPGPDGLTAEFYKTLKEEITGSLHTLYNSMMNGEQYFPTCREAHIKVLPKKGRDPEQPSSYHPISLINQDAKILSKILANRLAEVIPKLIDPSQAGFVKGRSAVLNISKALMALEHAERNHTKDTMILSLDAEKAFDEVSF